jgi:tetratricopeptide (TPR) repeat protein
MKLFILGIFVGMIGGICITNYGPSKSKNEKIAIKPPVPVKVQSPSRPEIITIQKKSPEESTSTLHKLTVQQIANVEADKLVSDALDAVDPSVAYDIFQKAYLKSPTRKVLEQYSNFLVNYQIWDEAPLLLKKCVAMYPDSDLCQGNLVNYSFQEKNLEKRKSAIHSCLEVNPDNLMCLNSLGVYSLETRQFDIALMAFKKMAQLNGASEFSFDDKLIDWGIGLSFRGMGDKTNAEEYFERACYKNYQPACIELNKLG